MQNRNERTWKFVYSELNLTYNLPLLLFVSADSKKN
jgi:hypothetical protein